jgi:ankyrin repeat protein
MKKKRSLLETIFSALTILFILIVAGPFGIPYYYGHYSTEAKLQKYIKTNNIEKLKKLKLSKGINGYYGKGTLYDIVLASGTPLAYAIESNNAEVVKYFIENGADVNLDGTSGDRHFNIPEHKPLHIAAEKGNKEIVELLIKNGADVNAKDAVKSTPLSIATKEGHIEIAELLIANGAKE